MKKAIKERSSVNTVEIKKGKYRHYKGNEYEVLCVATDSEDLSKRVVYKALYGDNEIWVRPLSMWNDIIGFDENSKPIKRFEFISE